VNSSVLNNDAVRLRNSRKLSTVVSETGMRLVRHYYDSSKLTSPPKLIPRVRIEAYGMVGKILALQHI
jgi:hypothetical protein